MSITIKDIESAYNDAKHEEIELMKAEAVLREQTLKVQCHRQNLVKYKDQIATLHREISEPVYAVESMESVTFKTA